MKKNKTSQITTGVILLLLTMLALACTQARSQSFCVSVVPTVTSGSNGICPGGYVGKAVFTKTVAQGWGWTPTNAVHTATDTNRTDTKIEFQGKAGDVGCNQTTVTVPDPTTSPKYRFTVYFANNVPTNSYPIVLTGFMP